MLVAEDFLTNDEENAVVASIAEAEKYSTGEIRIHIASISSIPALDSAKQVFMQLGMSNTPQRNAILIYVSISKREVVVCGDVGVHSVVPDDYWDQVSCQIISYFKTSRYAAGLLAGLETLSNTLVAFFPSSTVSRNKLSNEISKS